MYWEFVKIENFNSQNEKTHPEEIRGGSYMLAYQPILQFQLVKKIDFYKTALSHNIILFTNKPLIRPNKDCIRD